MPKKKTDRTPSPAEQAMNADERHVENNKTTPPKATPQKKDKPVGKYRDPNYKLVSVYLKKDTAKQAKKLLFDEEQDLSEKIQELLSGWVKENS